MYLMNCPCDCAKARCAWRSLTSAKMWMLLLRRSRPSGTRTGTVFVSVSKAESL